MKKAPLPRRGFLRLCVVVAGSAIAAACQKALTDAIAVGTSTAIPSPTPSVNMSLIGGNQDVWAWVKQVKVQVTDGECESMIIDVNRQEVAAQPNGEAFTAEVPLSEGENQVSAVCLQSGGGEVRSNPVIYTGRLRQVPTAVIQIALNGNQVTLDGSESVPAENDGTHCCGNLSEPSRVNHWIGTHFT